MPYQSRHASSLADLIMRQGDIEADRASRSGQMWGNVVRGVANIPAQIQQRKAAEQAAQMEQAQVQSRLATDDMQRRNVQDQIDQRGNDRMDKAAMEDAARSVRERMSWIRDVLSTDDPEQQRQVYVSGRERLIGEGRLQPQEAPDFFPGKGWFKSQLLAGAPIEKQVEQFFPEPKAPIPHDPTKDLLDPNTFEVMRPGTPEPKATPNPTEASLAAAAAAGDPRAREALRLLRAQQREPQGAQEPLVAIMGPNGEPVLVPRSQAAGKRPASTREQGRAVTSGDAGRIAEFDTSLDDLAILDQQLGTTGAASKVGAMLPNAVTEWTGWGSDAKQRQGTIDRVKQVIGKALEGGVLRKEDEYKYAKILPTIGDPPEVAKSKLAELRKALTQRRQTFIESLGDAGFDTGKFSARPARASEGAPAPQVDPLGIR